MGVEAGCPEPLRVKDSLAPPSSSVSIKAQVAARVGLTGSSSESEGGAGRSDPAPRKKGRLRAPPALDMLSFLKLGNSDDPEKGIFSSIFWVSHYFFSHFRISEFHLRSK